MFETLPHPHGLVASCGRDTTSSGAQAHLQDPVVVSGELGYLVEGGILPDEHVIVGHAVGRDDLSVVLVPGET